MEIPLKVAELDHVVLRCRDQNRALRFLHAHPGPRRRATNRADRTDPAARGPEHDRSRSRRRSRVEDGLNVDHICIGIEARDLHEVARYLREQSVEVMGEPAMRYGAHGAGLSIYVRDPEGNVVELKQMPAAS